MTRGGNAEKVSMGPLYVQVQSGPQPGSMPTARAADVLCCVHYIYTVSVFNPSL